MARLESPTPLDCLPMRRLLLALLVALITLSLPPARPAHAAPRCFPEAAPAITACIDGPIAAFWERQGGLPVFGYPLGPPYQAGAITVQPFERARLEHHPANPPPYAVQIGRLGAEHLAVRGEPTPPPAPPQPGCRHFAATGLNVCGSFLEAYGRYGLDLGLPGNALAESLALFGLPLTAPRVEPLSDGRSYTVQWFERARFEDHGPAGVRFGLLGRELPAPPPAAAPVAPGGFVQAQGDQLLRLGTPVQLKGVNYYPQGRPWAEMWQQWDGPQIERELRAARDQLGINTVRVLLPYDLFAGATNEGRVDIKKIERLRQLTRIAGDLDLRLIVTLFDFHEGFPAAGTREEALHKAYLRMLIGNFTGDDRILAWDLHNEPDHYKLWAEQGRAPEVLDWLGRMADEVHALAPHHLVTVGMGHYEHLYAAGPDGRRVVDYSDLVSVHIYNAADAARQLAEVRRHTDRPILLEEFGWPSGPECVLAEYTEETQDWFYRTTLAAAQGRVAGVIAWSLRDYVAGPTMRWDTREEHYGLVRADGSLKPAAAHLRAWPGAPLPSLTRVEAPLTVEGLDQPTGIRAPLLIAETGHYLKGAFREAYELLSGRYSFGPPISEPFERIGDRRVVQYYSGALLAYYPEAADTPGFDLLSPAERARRLVLPLGVGEQHLAERGVTARSHEVADEFVQPYERMGGRWRFGAALTPLLEEPINGVTTRVQYFQYGSLIVSPTTGAIEPGPLGTLAWQAQCAATGQR
jgi:hypothetical protein